MQLYNKTRELVKILQQFKHTITDKITSANRINS